MIIARNLAVGLAAVLIASLAWAQEAAPEDDVLQRYGLATESLAEATATLPDDPVAARTALDQAFSALLTLSRGGSGTFNDSLDRVFERARTAIENRSPTDLAVQTAVLRGGFQRLLYESALTSAVEGDAEVARARLERLASDVDVGTARLEGFAGLTDAGQMRRVLEAGVAEQIADRLATLAEAGAPEDRDAAYRTFANAYADYLLVQDSGRIDPAANRRFVETAQALVDGDDETYLATVTTLADDLTSLRDAADAGTQTPTEEAPGGAVAELPSGTPDDTDPTTEAAPQEDVAPDDATAEQEATETADDAEPAGDEPGDEQATRDEATTDVAEGVADGEIDVEALREEIAAELEDEREAEARAALEEELASLGVADEARSDLASRLRSDDVATVGELEREIAALASSIDAHVLRGDAPAASQALDDLQRRYLVGLGGVAAEAAPIADGDLRALVVRLDQAPGLRTSDAALLASQLQALSNELRGDRPSTIHALTAAVGGWWSDWIRPAVMIALALLALLPLRLLGLAFGGGNPNWRRVGTALFLLVLPVLVEGVIGAAVLLAGPLNVPSLAGWTAASVFASDLTQMVWAAVMLIAVVLASIGFYGICVQFGVLGRRKARAATASTKRTGDDTLVDWDDDF